MSERKREGTRRQKGRKEEGVGGERIKEEGRYG